MSKRRGKTNKKQRKHKMIKKKMRKSDSQTGWWCPFNWHRHGTDVKPRAGDALYRVFRIQIGNNWTWYQYACRCYHNWHHLKIETPKLITNATKWKSNAFRNSYRFDILRSCECIYKNHFNIIAAHCSFCHIGVRNVNVADCYIYWAALFMPAPCVFM